MSDVAELPEPVVVDAEALAELLVAATAAGAALSDNARDAWVSLWVDARHVWTAAVERLAPSAAAAVQVFTRARFDEILAKAAV